MMFNAKGLLDQLVGSGVAGGLAGGLAGGALANVLAGKKARKLAGSALQVGGLALVGGLAYKAWKNYQQGAGPGASPTVNRASVDQAAFVPEAADVAGSQALSLLLVRAMIAAAKADGQIDTQESQKILEQINGLGLPAEDKAFLFEEYARPLDMQALCSAVDTPEHAAEVYAASLLMLDPPSAPERIYLDQLAGALGLDPGLITELNRSVRGFEAAA